MVRTRNRNAQAANQEPGNPAGRGPRTPAEIASATETRGRTRTRAAAQEPEVEVDEPEEDHEADEARQDQERERGRTRGNSPTRAAAREETRAAVPARTEQRSLATNGNAQRSPFGVYGAQMSISSITGTLIKFNKGDWVTGDDEDLEENIELVCNMDQLFVGWIKWLDQRPTEQIMGRVVDCYQAPRRNELGDLNQDDWEIDDQGRARDPWQFSNYIVMKEPGQSATEENLFTFATSSKGGLGAIGALCRTYDERLRTDPGTYPIVRLESDSYNHRTYGRTKIPVLTVVGWEPTEQFEEPVAVTRGASRGRDAQRDPDPAPATSTRGAGGRSAGRSRRA